MKLHRQPCTHVQFCKWSKYYFVEFVRFGDLRIIATAAQLHRVVCWSRDTDFPKSVFFVGLAQKVPLREKVQLPLHKKFTGMGFCKLYKNCPNFSTICLQPFIFLYNHNHCSYFKNMCLYNK